MNYNFYLNKSILIQGAMDVETEFLLSSLSDKNIENIGNWIFYTGFIGEIPVVISTTYQGMVNSGVATALALSKFNIAAIINQGICGGYDRELHVGDIIIADRLIPYASIIRPFANSGDGVDSEAFEIKDTEVYNRAKGGLEKVDIFTSDKVLVEIAGSIEEFSKSNKLKKIKCGAIGSADEWNNQLDRIAYLRERFGILGEDMESAAVAQIAYSYNIPFIGIRILSNTIVNNEDLDEAVALDGQKFVIDYVGKLGEYVS